VVEYGTMSPFRVAAVVLACLVAGCGGDEGDRLPEVYPAEDHAYMKDPAFKARLEAQDRQRTTILDEREAIIAEAVALETRYGSRAAAEKSPEYPALDRRMRACEQAFESNRWETTRLMAERMKRAQEDSARIARGEAKAKE